MNYSFTQNLYHKFLTTERPTNELEKWWGYFLRLATVHHPSLPPCALCPPPLLLTRVAGHVAEQAKHDTKASRAFNRGPYLLLSLPFALSLSLLPLPAEHAEQSVSSEPSTTTAAPKSVSPQPRPVQPEHPGARWRVAGVSPAVSPPTPLPSRPELACSRHLLRL